jgi:hypothetical protein
LPTGGSRHSLESFTFLHGSGISLRQVLRVGMLGLRHKRTAQGAHVFMAESFAQRLGDHAGHGLRGNAESRDVAGGLKTLQRQAVSLFDVHGSGALLDFADHFIGILP